MKKILYIHAEENIAHLINRIENTEEEEIYIAADAHPLLFDDTASIRLFKREAKFLSKKITIVSENKNVLRVARNASFKAVSMNAFDVEHEEDVSSEHEEDVSSDSDTHVRGMHYTAAQLTHDTKGADKDSKPAFFPDEDDDFMLPGKGAWWDGKLALLSIGVAAVFILGAVYFLSPKLSLRIVPKKEMLHFDVRVTADTELSQSSLEEAIIPGKIINIDDKISGNFSASGKQNEDAKSTGEITIYNEFSGVSQTLVQKTRFKSKDGKVFRIKNKVTVPGAKMNGSKVVAPGTVTVLVEADKSGSSYNISPSEFSIPGFEGTQKFFGFYGKSSKTMTGGAASETLFATRNDLNEAKASLMNKLAKSKQDLINKNIPTGLKALPDGVVEETVNFSVGEVNEQGSFTGTLDMSLRIFVFNEDDVSATAQYHVSDKMTQNQKVVPGTRVLTYAQESLGTNDATLHFTVKVSELTAGFVDQDALRSNLLDKSEQEIKEILRGHNQIETVELTFWPFWSSNAPNDPSRIIIDINDITK